MLCLQHPSYRDNAEPRINASDGVTVELEADVTMDEPFRAAIEILEQLATKDLRAEFRKLGVEDPDRYSVFHDGQSDAV